MSGAPSSGGQSRGEQTLTGRGLTRPDLLAALGALLLAVSAWTLFPVLAPPGDPFHLTFAVAPAVAVALAWIGRRAAARSGRRPRRMGGIEGLLWLAVYLSLPFRHSLGWAFDDGPWAAALVIALASAVARRLVDLRPLVGRTTRPAALFFFLPLVVYLAIQPWALATRPANGDEPYNLLLAHSLAYDLDIDLDNQYLAGDSLRFLDRNIGPQRGDPVARDGASRSRHNAFLPLILAPGYRLAGRAGAAATMAILTAASAWLFLRLALRIASSRGLRSGAFLAWALVAFLPPLLVYAHQIWVEVPAALLFAFAVDRLWTLRQRVEADAEPSRRDLFLFIAALVLLPLLKLRLLLLAVPLLALALPVFLRRPLRPRRLVLLLGLPAAALVAILAFNAWVYGNPFKLYTPHEAEVLLSSPWRYLRGFVGIFWDCAFGLFALAPLWLLLLPGLARLYSPAQSPAQSPGQSPAQSPGQSQSQAQRLGLPQSLRLRLRLDLVVLSVPYLLALAPRLEWYGGWAPPFRYPLALLPLLGLLLVPILALRKRAGVHFLLVFLGVPTLLSTLIWTVAPSWTYHLADGSQQILHQAGIQLGADVSRFFPSTVRPRVATFVWVGLSLLAIPLARWGGRGEARRRAGSVAVALLFAFLVLLPWAAETLPTRHVEVEDAWVAKHGGALMPDRWQLRRPERASGWLLSSGARLEIPVVSGGDEVRIRVRAARQGRGTNQLRVERVTSSGEVRELGFWSLEESGRFSDFPVEPTAWSAGDRLVISNPQKAQRMSVGVVVDYVDLCWSGASPGAP